MRPGAHVKPTDDHLSKSEILILTEMVTRIGTQITARQLASVLGKEAQSVSRTLSNLVGRDLVLTNGEGKVEKIKKNEPDMVTTKFWLYWIPDDESDSHKRALYALERSIKGLSLFDIVNPTGTLYTIGLWPNRPIDQIILDNIAICPSTRYPGETYIAVQTTGLDPGKRVKVTIETID